MRNTVFLSALLATGLIQGAEAPLPTRLASLPAGWTSMGGSGPDALPGGACDIGIDSQKSTTAQQVFSVRCANAVLPSFGGARQTIQTAQYRGKRVRVSAWVMGSGIEGVSTPQYASVVGEAGLWLGVGSPRNGVTMDRMQGRGVKGSSADWEYRDFVVDVPQDNRQMLVGFWMQGKGQVWVRDFRIEEVPNTVAVNFLVKDPERAVGPDLSLLASASARPSDVFLVPPAKWLTAGGKGFELCDVGVDARMLKEGQRNLTIACSVPQNLSLSQTFQASPFWGKRVRFSGWLKIENFEPSGIEGARGDVGIFMNNPDRQAQSLRGNVSGTTGWQLRELVMDVPRNSTWLHIGLSLNGTGQVWGRDFKFEEVPRNTPVTEPPAVR